MKRLLWFSRNAKPVIEIVLDEESARWLLDRLPHGDLTRSELQHAIDKLDPEAEAAARQRVAATTKVTG